MGLPSADAKPRQTLGNQVDRGCDQREGVALGDRALVAEYLAAGRLVSLSRHARPEIEWGYDLVYRVPNQGDPKARAFQNWIPGEAREFMAGSSTLNLKLDSYWHAAPPCPVSASITTGIGMFDVPPTVERRAQWTN
jgi:LysR family glycine cleavage system transcriptional activator